MRVVSRKETVDKIKFCRSERSQCRCQYFRMLRLDFLCQKLQLRSNLRSRNGVDAEENVDDFRKNLGQKIRAFAYRLFCGRELVDVVMEQVAQYDICINERAHAWLPLRGRKHRFPVCAWRDRRIARTFRRPFPSAALRWR